MNNSCPKIRTQLALLAGGDLDPASAARVERHLSACPDCRAYVNSLNESLGALREVSQLSLASGKIPSHSSVWNLVSSRINALEQEEIQAGISGWVPVAAMAAACFFMGLVGFYSPDDYSAANSSPQISRTSLSNSLRPLVQPVFRREFFQAPPATEPITPAPFLRARRTF